MNFTFEEFLMKTFGFYITLPKAPSASRRRKKKREVNAVLMLGF